jgi:ribosome-interacting GTPase 1
MIPSMGVPAPAFLSVSFLHTRMTSRKRQQDRCTSVTPMASDVSCNETVNKDNLEMSLFPLLEQKHVRIMNKQQVGKKKKETEEIRGRGVADCCNKMEELGGG